MSTGAVPSTLAPKGETTHYDLCVALLLQIMFAVHAKGASNLSPLRTFGPAGRQPSSPQGLSIGRQPPKGENAEMVREVYDSLFFSPYLSFPLEGKSREAGKGVRG